MIAYWAVIKDSFHEAFSSVTLRLVLALVTAFLLSLAPIGYGERLNTRLQVLDVRDWPILIATIMIEANTDGPSPGKHIWSLLDERERDEWKDFLRRVTDEPDKLSLVDFALLTERFNELIRRDDFFQPESWQDREKTQELNDLLTPEQDKSLTDEDGWRRNRLLLVAAYPKLFVNSPQHSLYLSWFHWDTIALPGEKDSLDEGIQGFVAFLMNINIGFGIVFVGILVTSPIIPRIFEPGSISLLFSKPISRSLLFLSKFVGGCAFVLVCAAYLIGGFWLIMGLRFGLWNHKLLLCIPIFLFLFAVYYSVSALAGVVWKNAIVCVLITVIFWVVSFALWLTKSSLENLFVGPQRIERLVVADGMVVGIRATGVPQRWEKTRASWQPVMLADHERTVPDMIISLPPLIGPVHHKQTSSLLAIPNHFGSLGHLPPSTDLWVGRANQAWQRTKGARVPAGAVELLTNRAGHTLLVAKHGIYRLDGDPAKPTDSTTLFGVELPVNDTGPFQLVTPQGALEIVPPASAAISPDDDVVAIFCDRTIYLFASDDEGNYLESRQTVISDLNEDRAIIALAGSQLVLATADGEIRGFETSTLEETSRHSAESNSEPIAVLASPGGKLAAVLFDNGRLWTRLEPAGTWSRRAVGGQGDISAAAIGPDSLLLVVTRGNVITEYSVESLGYQRRYGPPQNMIEKGYRYLVSPLYAIFPQPGNLKKTVRHLLSQDERPIGSEPKLTEQTAKKKEAFDPWSPVWSSLAFMVVVLGIACWRIERTEF